MLTVKGLGMDAQARERAEGAEDLSSWKRTHDCGALRAGDCGKQVTLMGWVHSRRDLGNLIFVDLRDREGMTQIVFDPRAGTDTHDAAHRLRNEWVIAVRGEVTPRAEGRENRDLATGAVEVQAQGLRILNETETPPFQVDGAVDASEVLRLKYRYLELRRPQIQGILRRRHEMARCIRAYLDDAGFVDVETPFLTRSTPEGARDYLVPSRVNKGLFYALPQSPQLFKQLLMVAGFDRYYQIVRCFRDEDLRADRQPEFTQVDMEMSFVDENDVMALTEGMVQGLLRQVFGRDLPLPLPRMGYDEAMERFGTDRPDTRFAMELRTVTDIAVRSEFRLFRETADKGGCVKALLVEGGGPLLSRKTLDALGQMAQSLEAKGLATIKVTDAGWQSSLSKFFGEEDQKALLQRLGATQGDLVLLVADRPKIVNQALSAIRLHLGRELKRIDEGALALLWVVAFPLVEYDEGLGRYVAVHHPFTAPMEEDLPLLETAPSRVRARAYDIVLNGTEIGGGSLRIHQSALQQRIFMTLGISEAEAQAKFGFLIEALRYGAPPHGGLALGFDRLVAMLCGAKSIRETIAFPKTTSATCLMTDAPSRVDPDQLRELGLGLEPA